MKKLLVLLIAAHMMSAAYAQTFAMDARTEHALLVAHRTANDALQTYRGQPNGTTRAIADFAYCSLRDRRAAAIARGFDVTATDRQVEALRLSRQSFNLPAVQCSPLKSPLRL